MPMRASWEHNVDYTIRPQLTWFILHGNKINNPDRIDVDEVGSQDKYVKQSKERFFLLNDQ